MSHHQHQPGAIARAAIDFCNFYGIADRLERIFDAINEDTTFERAMVAIGLAGLVVIGMTL